MRALIALICHALWGVLLLASVPAWAQAQGHVQAHAAVVAEGMAPDAGPDSTHTACDTHRSAANPMASHGSNQRCKQACLALSAGFSAVLPMQAPALRLADGPAERPEACHALPTGRVVMPERRPPRAA